MRQEPVVISGSCPVVASLMHELVVWFPPSSRRIMTIAHTRRMVDLPGLAPGSLGEMGVRSSEPFPRIPPILLMVSYRSQLLVEPRNLSRVSPFFLYHFHIFSPIPPSKFLFHSSPFIGLLDYPADTGDSLCPQSRYRYRSPPPVTLSGSRPWSFITTSPNQFRTSQPFKTFNESIFS